MKTDNLKKGQIIDFTYKGESIQMMVHNVWTMSIMGILQHEISLFGVIWKKGDLKYIPLDDVDDIIVIQDVEKEEKCRGE